MRLRHTGILQDHAAYPFLPHEDPDGLRPCERQARRSLDEVYDQRQKGFLGTMYQYGYQVPDERIFYSNSTTEEGYLTTLKILHESKRPRGIVCENNTLAVGAMKAIEQSGLTLPKDIAFLTFDAYPYTQIIDPKPTVIDINVYDMGVQAGNMMIRKLENPSLLVQSYTTIPVILEGQTT